MRPPLKLTETIKRTVSETAAKYDASAALHTEDELLRYIVATNGEEAGSAQYISGGWKSAQQVKSAINRLFPERDNLAILEFASGFGRVTRHLPNLILGSHLTASDIHPTACQFVENEFGVKSVVSSHEPERLRIDDKFDFVFVLSLFSHLPDHSFGRWLAALYERLNPGGYLLLTSNGQVTMKKRAEFWDRQFDPNLGFGFARQSDQLDLDAEEYGSMVISLSYMAAQLRENIPGALLHGFASGAWFGQQDEWIVQKTES